MTDDDARMTPDEQSSPEARRATPPHAVGVTGGIGSGKTEVCKAFAALGAHVYPADDLAKELLNTHADVRTSVIARFGSDVYGADGTLDRKRLARLAFGDDTLLANLNAIVHPRVTERLREIIKREKSVRTAPLIVVEAALIYEAGIEELFDFIIAVEAAEPVRIDRVAGRDGSSREKVVERMRAQLPPENLAERADFLIRNSGDLDGLRSRCAFLFALLTRIEAPPKGATP